MNNNEYLFEEINMLLDTINKLKFNKVKISDEEKLLLSMQLFKCCLLRSGVTNDGSLYILTRLFASVPFENKKLMFNDNSLQIVNENSSNYLIIEFNSNIYKEIKIRYKEKDEQEVFLEINQKSLSDAVRVRACNLQKVITDIYLDDDGVEVWELSTINSSFSKNPYVKLCRKYSRAEADLSDCWSRGLYACAVSDIVFVYGKAVVNDKKYEYFGKNINDLIAFPNLEENVKSNTNYDELFYKMLYSNSQNLKKYFSSILNAFEEHKQNKIRKLF